MTEPLLTPSSPIVEIQNIPTQLTPKNRPYLKYFIIIISSVITQFILLPVTLLLLINVPPFSLLKIGWFANIAIVYAFPVSVFLDGLFLFIFLKFFLKQKRYAFIGVGLFVLLIAASLLYGIIQKQLFINKLDTEINTKSIISKQTIIEITDFQATPTYDTNGVVTKMTFKMTFNSNTTADMGIYPLVSLWANHKLNGKPFRFSIRDIDNNKSGDIMNDKHDSNTVITGKNTIMFSVSNFMYTMRPNTSDNKGKFEVALRFNVHTSDPYGFGQGNATSVENIRDLSGKAILDPSENKLGEVYLTETYKVFPY